MHKILALLFWKFRDRDYQLRSWLGKFPNWYFKLFARKYPFSEMAVKSNTALCIEGFPRSANSYAVVAFRLVNRDVTVAHHLHVAAQITQSCLQNIPAIAVLRNPKEAVASFLVFQSSKKADIYLKAYVDFHKTIEPFSDNILYASFETVTSDFNKVILEANKKFNRKYNTINNLSEREDEIFAKLKKVNNQFFAGQSQKNMAPDESRKKLKEQVKKQIEASRYLNAAMDIYTRLNAQSV